MRFKALIIIGSFVLAGFGFGAAIVASSNASPDCHGHNPYCSTTTISTTTITTTTPTTTTTTTPTTTTTSSSQTFVSDTGWARPDPATPTVAKSEGWNLVPFTDKTSLLNAISNMQPHDYIYYAGTGILTISSSTTNAFSILNHNPSGRVVIDFGTSQSMWNPATESGNYVKFVYTGTSQYDAMWINADSNLTIFGGDFSNVTNGGGIVINAPTHDFSWYDAYLHSIAGSGISVRGSTSNGTASVDYNLIIRAEVNGFALNPAEDNHADKGTGQHGLILHGNSGDIRDSTFAIDARNSLPPGGISLTGITQPEGSGGSAIEQGISTSSSNYSNDTLYANGTNLLMEPGHGTNPGSTGIQTGGNLYNLWGSAKLNGNLLYGWGNNLSGAMLHSDNGTWFPGSPPLTYVYGRASNTNQYTGGGNISQPYPTTDPAGTPLDIIYQDCQ